MTGPISTTVAFAHLVYYQQMSLAGWQVSVSQFGDLSRLYANKTTDRKIILFLESTGSSETKVHSKPINYYFSERAADMKYFYFIFLYIYAFNV